MNSDIKYDIALSFAGEDRDYVQEVAKILRASGVNVFYGHFLESELWGKIYTHIWAMFIKTQQDIL